MEFVRGPFQNIVKMWFVFRFCRPSSVGRGKFQPRSLRQHFQRFAEANSIVGPIHPKAMPVILTTTEEFDLWLEGETVEALKLQRPWPDEALRIMARGEKEDGAPAQFL